MEQIDLAGELDTTGHTVASYNSLLTKLGFGRARNGMRTDFHRGLAVEIRETLMGCEIRGYRL